MSFFLITINAVQRKKTNSKFRSNELRKFRMLTLLIFEYSKSLCIYHYKLSVTDCLDNFLSSTTKHNEVERKQNHTT